MTKYDCIDALTKAGIVYQDATALRRISMTLHRWHEQECGDCNNHGSWCITRGRKDHAPDCPVMFAVDSADYGLCNCKRRHFVHDDDGKPFMEHHHYTHGQGKDTTTYSPMPDRERGALKRLAKIMASYPGFLSYVQTDPRGCSLYILRPADTADLPDGANGGNVDVSSVYTRGIAVYK